jgi:hypothetical protein
VQVFHETFRSFFFDPERCPSDYFLAIETAHGDIASVCLDYMCNVPEKTAFTAYAAKFWLYHLTRCSPQQRDSLLINLHHFFTSDGLGVWIKYGRRLRRGGKSAVDISSEVPFLNSIFQWLQQFVTSEHPRHSLSQQVNSLLINLRHFFTSDGLIVWIKYVLSKILLLKSVVGSSEVPLLKSICHWLQRFENPECVEKQLSVDGEDREALKDNSVGSARVG